MEPKGETLPLDHLQGLAPPYNTPAYSNNYDKHDEKRESQDESKVGGASASAAKKVSQFESTQFGVLHQCVGFARRWAWDTYGLWLPTNVDVAHQIFHVPWIYDAKAKRRVPVKATRNGTSAEFPTTPGFLIYASHFGNFPGHIAVLTRGDPQAQRVYAACQNRHYKKWDGDYSVVHTVEKNSAGKWVIVDKHEPVLGWVTFPGYDRPVPLEDDAGNPILSPDALPASPKIADRANFTALRRLPPGFDPSTIKYDEGWFKAKLWFSVMMEFQPHWVVFPFFFAYMITKFLVVWPIMSKLGFW